MMPPMTPSVLVVDDDRAIREMLKDALEGEGYTVWTLADGSNVAATLLTANRPCLVLLDLMMPGVNGWEVCRQLAADRRFERHAVVLMTAGLVKGDATPTYAHGLLPKPFDLSTLYSLVERYTDALSALGPTLTQAAYLRP